MKLSASPFALGCSGVTLWCSNPISSVQSFKYVELNGGPLSDSIFFGILCVANIFLSLSAQQQENVSFCQSPLYYSGPPKSIEAVSQAVSGIVDDLTGSYLCSTVAIWHW